MELDIVDNNNKSRGRASKRVSQIYASEIGILDNLTDDESEVLG
jgi:hypothetical protein